ncbi:mitochondrial 37S ribosomal protein mS37 ASCRUDRAFT_73296 [Ascoidea rubescens DSM 1968]|uniref:37S ribosomal protein mrp10, mitochondrial n=1 Tax=Ascoidea rubescens DSM 1968 TaxID=1344418 RepID=A0A1D2VPA2_9ASCO|nr:hypothetical protein ASCRUDRAFT_73296 [Ascoidea rubescens DSM 1968]ODV63438.1 hypothetical protein ASCRUDRAFT_73296 [Ascoidea rubescens DSM 1968]
MANKPTRLPPLPRLKVRKPLAQVKEPNKCIVMMSALLNCWASNGEGSTVCSSLQTDLTSCMETYKPPAPVKSPINYHAGRLYPKISGYYKG